jgi:hypothetical protein
VEVLSSDEISNQYSQEIVGQDISQINGFATIVQGKPVIVLNKNVAESPETVLLHEMMHFVLATIKSRNYDGYSFLLNGAKKIYTSFLSEKDDSALKGRYERFDRMTDYEKEVFFNDVFAQAMHSELSTLVDRYCSETQNGYNFKQILAQAVADIVNAGSFNDNYTVTNIDDAWTLFKDEGVYSVADLLELLARDGNTVSNIRSKVLDDRVIESEFKQSRIIEYLVKQPDTLTKDCN